MVFSQFKEFKALLENHTSKKIKVLRTNDGNKFCSTTFDKFCKENVIEGHKTNAYTPQQNRVVEQMNRTLMERDRSMLSAASLDKKVWVEVIDTSCYLISKSPTSNLVDKTLMEVYTGNKGLDGK